MKRSIFLSLRMHNRTDEAIKATRDKMIAVITAMFPEDELQFIDNIVCPVSFNTDIINGRLLYLGEAISKMAYCDTFVCINDWYHEEASGCRSEERVARTYGLNVISLNEEFMGCFYPDLAEKGCYNTVGECEA